MRVRPKRLLFLAHRWLGVAMCVFFAVWFASGIVMMYVEYPELTEAERLANLAEVDLAGVRVPAAGAAAAAAQDCAPARLSLSRTAGRPAYHLISRCGERATVFADTGERLERPVTPALALATAADSGFAAGRPAMRYAGPVDMDQWTVSEALGPHRPLHRVELDDGLGTVLYVSDTTGQIVRDTHARERLWNWVGSTLHWIYPYQLRRHRGLWVDVVVYLSIAGIVSVVTGAVIGFMRLRPLKGYGRRGMSPYRGMARWHHILGLGFLLFVSTYIFSGLMSMTPWGIFDPAVPAEPQIDRYTGGPLASFADFPDPAAAQPAAGVREIEWLQIAGEGHLVFRRAADRQKAVVAAAHDPQGALRVPVLSERIVQAAAAFIPDASVVETEVLTEHDDYYYTRHNRHRPLPVYRIAFDDPSRTWFYVDLTTGEVVQRHTRETRLGRWLYNGLHSLDFGFLLRLGPGWDVLVITLSIAGFGFAVTSVVLGWRRLRLL